MSDSSLLADPIAIVGMGCRFPGQASSPAKFWELLCNGGDAIIDLPEDRWSSQKFFHKDANAPGKMYVTQGGYLQEGWNNFDAEFFQISPKEAQYLDPQQRLLLELAWEALENGGLIPSRLRGTEAGVFIGAFTTDWQTLHNQSYNIEHCGIYSGINGSMTILSARLAHFLDWRGPCFTVDTACSSSLVALHLACQSLWRQECHVALAGGVNAMLVPQSTIALSKGRFLNPEGRCRPFAHNAMGYVRGEGGGVVILKRLQDALKNQDSIYALIKATGVNHDGYTPGIAMPNPKSQEALIRKVLESSQVDPASIQYVEAHGTGTSVGDPLEAQALNAVLNLKTREHPCFIGAVKSNIGHLEAAAGIAGLIKTALCLRHKKIPPNLHYSQPNPKIPLDQYCLKFPSQTEQFYHPQMILAGVNAFGYGGTNAHAVLQSYDMPVKKAELTNPFLPYFFPLSAKHPQALKESLTLHLNDIQKSSNSIEDRAYSLQHKRSHLSHRAIVSASNQEELVHKLTHELKEGLVPKKILGQDPPLIFVYTGMGPQWWGMGKELSAKFPPFREIINCCEQIFYGLTERSLLEELVRTKESYQIEDPVVAQVGNFALQVALTHLLNSWGITPDLIVGHSVGEIAGAYASKAITLEEGMNIAYHRARLQALKAGQGGMLAVGASVKDIEEDLKPFQASIEIAAYNSRKLITLAGDQEDLKKLSQQLDQKEIFNRFLRVNIAYHSHQMESLEDPLKSSLKHLAFNNKPKIPLYSTVAGLRHEDRMDGDYWWKNLRQPVLFSKAIQNIVENHPSSIFLEIGPHPVLASALKDHLLAAEQKGEVICTLNRQKEESTALVETLQQLYVNGYSLDWSKIAPSTGRFIQLPTYPWQKKPFWVESIESRQYRLAHSAYPLLSKKIAAPMLTWQTEVNSFTFEWLKDHRIGGMVVFPGAAYLEAALELFDQTPCLMEKIEFSHLLTIKEEQTTILQLTLDENFRFHIYSLAEKDPEEWLCHSKGFCSAFPMQHHTPFDFENWRALPKINVEELYDQFDQYGLQYGPAFQGIVELRKKGETILSYIKASCSIDGYKAHPTLLDAAFQTLIGSVNGDELENEFILPYAIDQLHVYRNFPQEIYCSSQLILQKSEEIVGNISIYNLEGEICAIIKGLHCKRLKNSVKDPISLFYHPCWELKPLESKIKPLQNTQWIISLEESLAVKVQDALKLKGANTQKIDSLEEILHIPDQTLNLIISCSAASSELDLIIRWVKLAKQLAYLRHDQSIMLWIFTYSTQKVTDNDEVKYQDSSVWGFARVIRQEYPWIDCRLVDIDYLDEQSILGEIQSQHADLEVAYRDQKRYIFKLKRSLEPTVPAIDLTSPQQDFRLDLKKAGSIENLYFQEYERSCPKDHEVGLEVCSTSLNFKDLMKVLGLLPHNVLESTYFGADFGMECSGTIVAVGKNVRQFKVGDQVCAFAPKTFQTYLNVSEHCLCPIPPGNSLEEAPTYIAFITVLRALKEIGKLKKHETILIHSATGAVGLAAIQYARYKGAKIIATASSSEKRAYLKTLGIDHCGDSRSEQFVEQVREWTLGKGVDVILNALAGRLLLKSWELLAPYGRFIEIGKRDISLNNALPMGQFNHNATFAAIDLDRSFLDQPKLVKKLLKEAYSCFVQKIFTPLPCQVFLAGQVKDAFNHMARSKHMGKIMLKMARQTVSGFPQKRIELLVEKGASYLITGGLSGFGIQVAKWLVEKGAKSLILVSRRKKISSEVRSLLKSFEKRKVFVKITSLDITDKKALEDLFEECQKNLLPIKGIVHSAMVLKDAFIAEIQEEQIIEILKPKVVGTLNLHEVSLTLPLNFFVLFSSISSLIGNIGQGCYAAANAFLDSFCHYRRSCQLPALTVNWGALNSGVLQRDQKVARHLKNCGMHRIPVKTALKALEKALEENETQVGVFDLDWNKLINALPSLKNHAAFSEYYGSLAHVNSNNLREKLASLEERERLNYLLQAIKAIVAQALKMEVGQLDIDVRLNQLGIDSLMAMELEAQVEKELNIKIPTLELMKGPTIKQMAQYCLKQISNA